MITWFFGQTGSGKTWNARRMFSQRPHSIMLDGNQMREVWPGLGFSEDDRMTQHERVARLAVTIQGQGHDVIVATIAPTLKIRNRVRKILQGLPQKFIYVQGGRPADSKYPFEAPGIAEYCEVIEPYIKQGDTR